MSEWYFPFMTLNDDYSLSTYLRYLSIFVSTYKGKKNLKKLMNRSDFISQKPNMHYTRCQTLTFHMISVTLSFLNKYILFYFILFKFLYFHNPHSRLWTLKIFLKKKRKIIKIILWICDKLRHFLWLSHKSNIMLISSKESTN